MTLPTSTVLSFAPKDKGSSKDGKVAFEKLGAAGPWDATPLKVHFHHDKAFKKVGYRFGFGFYGRQVHHTHRQVPTTAVGCPCIVLQHRQITHQRSHMQPCNRNCRLSSSCVRSRCPTGATSMWRSHTSS